MMDFLPFLQSLFGWIYFIAWGITGWPQILLMYKRGTTDGFSPDFMIINIVGFISYSIFTYACYFVPEAAKSYESATGDLPQVELTDVLFASHGAFICGILILQLIILPPRIPPNKIVTVISALFQLGVFLGLVGCVLLDREWYSYLQMCSYVKVISTFVKHFPQYILNRARGSTAGWSFTMIVMDIFGGTFSMGQQGVRALRMKSWAPFTKNPAKTFLAVESIAFDILFLAQHMLWYTDRSDPAADAQLRKKTSGIDDKKSDDMVQEEMVDLI